MTNKDKFLALVSKDENNTLDYIKYRIENRPQLRASRNIAYKVLDRLRELKWSQKELAEKLGVSPQQVNKIVKGSENLTLSTIIKLEEILSIAILAKEKEENIQPIENKVFVLNVIQENSYHHEVREQIGTNKKRSSKVSKTSQTSSIISSLNTWSSSKDLNTTFA
jgi:transcriptional regulator with XRE-family HTH domain